MKTRLVLVCLTALLVLMSPRKSLADVIPDQFLVRSGQCNFNDWKPFTTADQAAGISVWCHSQATRKKLKASLYNTINEATVCRLRCLVRAKYVNGEISTDPWASSQGCAAFVRRVTTLENGAVESVAGTHDASKTGNHCEIFGADHQDLFDTFNDSHFNCSGFVCP